MKLDTFTTHDCLHPTADDPLHCPPDGEEPPPPPPPGPSYSLILKPGYVLREVGDPAQFRTYLVNDETGEEQEVTQGLLYKSSLPSLILIGAISGRAFGSGQGIATISVQWQDKLATAQMEVIGSCADLNVGIMLVIDNSKSMELAFTQPPAVGGEAVYSTRLEFVKAVAHRYASELNTSKDYIGLVRFSDGSTLTKDLTQDNSQVMALINATPQSQGSTSIGGAIDRAAGALDTAFNDGLIDKKVIILLSDGEHKAGADPRASAEAFKGSGGVLVCVGARAHGDGYALLSDMAEEGLFLNGLKTNSTTTSTHLAGTKGYYCAGHCDPPGGVTEYHGELNYTRFENWDVIAGEVDLIGGNYPYEFFNLLPGNGLYVDLAGSGPDFNGHIRSKEAFDLIAGHTYKLSFYLAGNQRWDGFFQGNFAAFKTIVKVENPELSVDETIEIDNFAQDFTLYEYTFVAPSSSPAKISFQNPKLFVSGIPLDGLWEGNLLDNILFEDLTDEAVLLQDNFDTENPTEIPPSCVSFSPSTPAPPGYGYGYCYGYGCLDEPIPQQVPDPSPLPVRNNE